MHTWARNDPTIPRSHDPRLAQAGGGYLMDYRMSGHALGGGVEHGIVEPLKDRSLLLQFTFGWGGVPG
jgi:hypothetical protein